MKRILMALAVISLLVAPLFGATGEGTAVISPATTVAGSSGNSLDILFTNGTTPYTAGTIIVVAPAGFTAFDIASPANPGYLQVSGGTVSGMTTDGKSVTISVATLANGASMHFFYANYTAPASAGAKTFIVKTDTDSTAPVAISTPAVITLVDPTATVTKTATPTITMTATPINTATTTKTNTATITTTSTITPTYTPTKSGSGYNTMVPAQITPDTAPVLNFYFYPNGFTWASGLLTLDVPADYPVPSLNVGTAGYVTVSAANGTLGAVTLSTRKISINVTSLAPYNSYIKVKYGNATPVETPLAAGAYTWVYSSAAKSQVAGNVTPVYPVMVGKVATATGTVTNTFTPTETATLTSAQMTKTATYAPPTSTATLTPTQTPTATVNPDSPITVNQPKVISTGLSYLKSFEMITRVNDGAIHVANCASVAGISTADFVWTFSPSAMTYPNTIMTFGGKGLAFSKGMTAYSDLTYTAAANNTITAHYGR